MLFRRAFVDHRYRLGAIVLVVILVRVDRDAVAGLKIANLRFAAGFAYELRRTRGLDGCDDVIVGFDHHGAI